jgi:hypothetical protein
LLPQNTPPGAKTSPPTLLASPCAWLVAKRVMAAGWEQGGGKHGWKTTLNKYVEECRTSESRVVKRRRRRRRRRHKFSREDNLLLEEGTLEGGSKDWVRPPGPNSE